MTRGELSHKGLSHKELRVKLTTLEAKLIRLRNFYATLARVNATLTRVQDKQALFEEVCQVAVGFGGFRTAWIGLLEEHTDRVLPVAKFGACPDYVGMSQVSVDGFKDEGRGPSGTAIRENRTDYIMDLETDPRSLPWRQDMMRCGFLSSISTPIHKNDHPIGVLTLYSSHKNVFSREEITLIEEIAQAISFALQYLEQNAQRARAEEQIHWLAYYDPLTKLPNRVFLGEYVNQRISTSQTPPALAVVFLDLDGFKEVNDTQGHAAGDRLLQEIASQLQNILKPGDLVSRFGGDEFVLVLHGASSEDDVLPVLREVQAAVSVPIWLDDTILKISCSIGVTFFHNEEDSAETLLRDADIAMYEAKDQGRDQVAFYKRDVVLRREEKKRWREDVEEALKEDQFCLYYQPQVNMKTGRVVGVEALIRWNHPQKGLLMPGQFLNDVLNSPIMNQIGNWVLDKAIAQLARWLAEGLSLKVSVNVSANQFQDPLFIHSVTSTLSKYPEVHPSHLKLELLEDSAFTDNFGPVQKNIEQCNELGLTVTLDDFGTGYSSLTHLQRLSVA